MNLKTKINIYKKIIDEVTKEYDGSGKFFRKKNKRTRLRTWNIYRGGTFIYFYVYYAMHTV